MTVPPSHPRRHQRQLRWRLTAGAELTMVWATRRSQAVHMVAGWNRFPWRRRHGMAREAVFLDNVVDAHLELISQLPVHRREEFAEALAVLVMLAQDHRYRAQGWISRRELRARAGRALAELERLLPVPGTATAMLRRVD